MMQTGMTFSIAGGDVLRPVARHRQGEEDKRGEKSSRPEEAAIAGRLILNG